jgi:uncharacterized membrane protein YfcA
MARAGPIYAQRNLKERDFYKMDLQQLLVVLTIIFLAGIAQSLVGFGYALFATPLLLWSGVQLTTSITVVATCALLQSLLGMRAFRAELPWRMSFTAAAGRCAGLALGLVILSDVAHMEMVKIRALIGAILCGVVVVQVVCRPRPVKTLHWGWGGVAFVSSGVLQGVCGMGGPPLVIWSMAHDWPGERMKGFLFAAFGLTIPVQLALLTSTFGWSILTDVLFGLACFPLVYSGSLIGLRIGRPLNRERLKTVAYALLLATGVSAIVPVLLHQP